MRYSNKSESLYNEMRLNLLLLYTIAAQTIIATEPKTVYECHTTLILAPEKNETLPSQYYEDLSVFFVKDHDHVTMIFPGMNIEFSRYKKDKSKYKAFRDIYMSSQQNMHSSLIVYRHFTGLVRFSSDKMVMEMERCKLTNREPAQ